MTQGTTGRCSHENRPAGTSFMYSKSGDMVWRGILARPAYAVSSKNVLLVGVNSLSAKSEKGLDLDRLNAEVTSIIALQQIDHRACNSLHAMLLKGFRPKDLWCVDVNKTLSLLDDYYFAQICSRISKIEIAPSAVVSYVIQQRLSTRTSK